jgi:hypothetical protein
VPWPATRLDAAGLMTQARYLLSDTYGAAVADWTVTLADTPPGRSYIACAIPAALRSALEDTLAPARLRLVSLQPQLVVAFNAWRGRLAGDDAWFVNADYGSLSAVHLTYGAWERVYMARLSADLGVELERLQAFGRLSRAASATSRMYVDAPVGMRRGIAVQSGVEWLEDDGDDAVQAHELALLRRAYA